MRASFFTCTRNLRAISDSASVNQIGFRVTALAGHAKMEAIPRFLVEKFKILRGGRLKWIEGKRIELPVEGGEYSTEGLSFIPQKSADCGQLQGARFLLDALCRTEYLNDSIAFVGFAGWLDLRLIHGIEELLKNNTDVRLLLEVNPAQGCEILKIARYLFNRNFVAQILSNGKLGRERIVEQSLKICADQKRCAAVVFKIAR